MGTVRDTTQLDKIMNPFKDLNTSGDTKYRSCGKT
jgi:hypothetical protein